MALLHERLQAKSEVRAPGARLLQRRGIIARDNKVAAAPVLRLRRSRLASKDIPARSTHAIAAGAWHCRDEADHGPALQGRANHGPALHRGGDNACG
jgi:hypothetical protein